MKARTRVMKLPNPDVEPLGRVLLRQGVKEKRKEVWYMGW